MTHLKRSGFSLIELIVYIGVFSIVSVFLTGTLFTTLKIQNRESAATEVQSQLNLTLQTVQRLVRESSLIEDVFEGEDLAPIYSGGVLTNPCTSAYCGVQLRMERSDPTDPDRLDPTIIWADPSDQRVYVKQGIGDEVAVTTANVLVNSFILAKNETPGAHAILKIDASFTNNPATSPSFFTKSINSAVGRATAATFDSSLLPNADNQYDVGQTVGSNRWRQGHFAGDVTVQDGNLGVGTSSPTQKIEVAGGIKITGSGNGITFPDGSVQTKACMPSGTCPVAAGGWTLDGPVAPATFSTVRLTTTTDVVGIGTTTVASGYKLHVNGQTKVVGGINVDNLTVTGTCTGCSLGAGTVTNVATGTGLTGGPITTTGTIAMPGLTACLATEAARWDGTNWSCVAVGGGGGGVAGTGTAGFVPKWTAATTLADSLIRDNGTGVGVGGAPVAGNMLNVSGNLGVSGNANVGGNIDGGIIRLHNVGPGTVQLDIPPGPIGAPITVMLTNNPAGAVRVAGEIVIAGPGPFQFDAVAVANVPAVLGVVVDPTCAPGAPCRIAVSGVVMTKAGVATAVGQHVTTSAVLGAAGAIGVPAPAGSSIGIWLQAVGAGAVAPVFLR